HLVPTLREYTARYGLTARRVDALRPDALVMHPGPMNRGVEISAEVADLPRSVIIDQVRNGVAVRMAVLYLLLGAGVDKVLGAESVAALAPDEPVDLADDAPTRRSAQPEGANR